MPPGADRGDPRDSDAPSEASLPRPSAGRRLCWEEVRLIWTLLRVFWWKPACHCGDLVVVGCCRGDKRITGEISRKRLNGGDGRPSNGGFLFLKRHFLWDHVIKSDFCVFPHSPLSAAVSSPLAPVKACHTPASVPSHLLIIIQQLIRVRGSNKQEMD